MPTARTNGIFLNYDQFGRHGNPPIVLIMGLGTQMIAWSEEFCRRLAWQGFRVIRFDNRDVGLSEKMHGVPKPSLGWAIAKAWIGLPVASPYSLDDMALDTIGLLDKLGIDKAHIVGASMGGMIAQIIAAKHANRCLSLTSMMSTSGARNLPGPSAAVRKALTAKRPPAEDRQASVQYGLEMLRTISSPGFPTANEDLMTYVERSYDRSVYPGGFIRQLLAVLANGSRADLLKTIKAPTLVLHGEADPLIPVEGGRDTARLIPGAKLVTIPGWAHDLPQQLEARLAKAIGEHCHNAVGAEPVQP